MIIISILLNVLLLVLNNYLNDECPTDSVPLFILSTNDSGYGKTSNCMMVHFLILN